MVDDDTVLLVGAGARSGGARPDGAAGGQLAGAGAADRARRSSPTAALVDLCIGDDSGIELLRELKARAARSAGACSCRGTARCRTRSTRFTAAPSTSCRSRSAARQLMEALERAALRARDRSVADAGAGGVRAHHARPAGVPRQHLARRRAGSESIAARCSASCRRRRPGSRPITQGQTTEFDPLSGAGPMASSFTGSR